MILKRKELLILMFVLGCVLQSSSNVLGEQKNDTNSFSVISELTNPLDNVTIELVSDLDTHREDKIPSVLPGSSFEVQFNITNLSDQELQSVEFYPEVNAYGELADNSTTSKSLITTGESWITQEYLVNLIATEGSGSTSSLDLVIVLDISGSMQDEIDVLKNDLITVVEELNAEVPDIRIGLVYFSGYGQENPYLNNNKLCPLTSDIQKITNNLADTSASGGYEPWGDALWVAQNRFDWREDAVKLVTLITDEPCDSGEIVGIGGTSTDYDGALLYELFSNYSREEFILCTVAASGANTLTKRQLKVGAEETGGTYIEIGSDGLQTKDLPQIIGEFIEKYTAELDLKLTGVLSYLNSDDIREYKEKIFTVLLDDLPPEIDHWIYFSEDFISDEKFVNIVCDIKDVTGVPYVEIYYKFSFTNFWITTNSSYQGDDRYLLSLHYELDNAQLFYQVYTKDWLNNEILTEVATVDLDGGDEYSEILSNKRKEIEMVPNQSILLSFIGDSDEDSYGMIFTTGDVADFSVIVADSNESTIILSESNSTTIVFQIPKSHVLKAQLLLYGYGHIIIANVIPEQMDFGDSSTRILSTEGAILLEIDNSMNDPEERSIMADSQSVQANILVFDPSSWEIVAEGYSEVVLPEQICFVLIFAEYHHGEIDISYNYETENKPYEHYYATEAMPWAYGIMVFGLIGLVFVIRNRRR